MSLDQNLDFRVTADSEANSSGYADPGDTPVNPYTLLNAVNETSELCHTGWLIFLGVVAYFCIAVAGVTHKDLLLNSAVELPIMQVSIDLTRFFLFAPILLVFLHFGLLVQHAMLARKVLEFDAAVRPLEITSRRTHPLRLELHSYYFTQQLAGPDRSPLFGGFLHGLFWLSVFGLPILVILYIQLVFLPFHDEAMTWAHRTALLVDAGLLVLLGVFLSSRSSSFTRAFGRSARFQPVSFLVTAALIATVVFFSLFVATIPDEPMDRIAAQLPATRIEVTADASKTPARRVFALTAWLFYDGSDGDRNKRALFRRNLHVTDETIVGGEKDQDVRTDDAVASVSLRGRDLRYAVLDRSVLENVDFTGANLRGASLIRTKLSRSRLSCLDIDAVLKKLVAREDACTRLEDVAFTDAQLNGADLRGAALTGAKFENAELNGADLRYAALVDVDFSGAQLRRALLSGGTAMLGANFLGAQLQGADLTGARMHVADFSGAGLQGAQLSFAQAYGANFQSAEMDGAVLAAAKLQGANFADATMTGVDLSSASIWQTLPTSPERLGFADLSQIRIRTLDAQEIAAVKAALDAIDRPRLRNRLERGLEMLLGNADVGWEETSGGQSWRTYKSRSGALEQGVFLPQLSDYLARTACEARFSDGAVAAGLIRRALSPNFKGSTVVLLNRIRTDTCPGARSIPEEQMMRLAAAAESTQQKATAQTSGQSGEAAPTVFLGGP